MTSSPSTRWNIFARELEDILAARHFRLGHLDDWGVVEHREKVGRLQRSLHSPAHYPTLNPDEIDRLIEYLHLTDVEVNRIHAALLATAVERILMDRINTQIALMAADDVFNILLAALQAQSGSAHIALRGVKEGAPTDDAEQAGDAMYDEALDLIDRATLSLHLSRQASTASARRVHAQDAAGDFARALSLLQRAQFPHHESDEWNAWEGEARHGREMAESLLDVEDAEDSEDGERGHP